MVQPLSSPADDHRISERSDQGAEDQSRALTLAAQGSLKELWANPNFPLAIGSEVPHPTPRDYIFCGSVPEATGYSPGYNQCRVRPPWNEPGPGLDVCYDFKNGDYIIRARGGHIIAATRDIAEVGRLVRHESHYGYGSVELLLSGRHPDDTWTYHGHGSAKSVGVRTKPRQRASPGLSLTLADLDLDL